MKNEVVLITGGSSGIGLACARVFAARGARVVLAARDAPKLREAAAGISGARAVPADVASEESVARLVRDLESTEGRLDVLLNCAGQFEVGPAEELGVEGAERMIRVNFLGAIGLTHALLPLLRRGERRSVVHVSSIAGLITPPYFAAYGASKAALTAYVHALRQELRADGIHIGLVFPGPVDTPLIAGKVRTRYYPLPRGVPMVSPERIAADIVRVVERRISERTVPRRLSGLLRVGRAYSPLVDGYYRLLGALGRAGADSGDAG
jgi:short-subunit dehydrogenase